MQSGGQDSATSLTASDSDDSMAAHVDNKSMGKEERKRRVLALLVETDTALPPQVIFHNVRRRGADFERRSVDNYLKELEADGYIDKVDEKRGYYEATQKGRDYYYNH